MAGQQKFPHGLNIGDRVQIMGDEKKVKQHQVDHGGWVDAMAGTIGQKGKIARLYQDGDVRVEVNGSSWTYNPDCLRVLERAPATASSAAEKPSTSSTPVYTAPSKSSYPFSSPVKSYKPDPPKVSPKPVPTQSSAPSAVLTEKPSCSVCFEDFDGEQHRMIVFVPCGHTACSQCTGRMSQCHVCRKHIATKMNVYI